MSVVKKSGAMVLALAAVLVALALPSTAQASPRHPGAGDRITLKFESDRQTIYSAVWINSQNRVNSTRGVPAQLSEYNRRTHRWSKTIVFTSQVRNQRLFAQTVSLGMFAKCTVWVNGVAVRQQAINSPLAQANCGRQPGPGTPLA